MIGVVSDKEWQDGLDYARALAAKFAAARGVWEEQEDLLSECYLGLVHAAELFERARGVKFTTYARYWMDQRMLRWLDLHWKRERHRGPSLDLLVGADQDTTLAELALPPVFLGEEGLLDRELLTQAWEGLAQREREVLYCRYWREDTLGEVAKRWGCTRQRVDQIQQRALRKLRFLLGDRLNAVPSC